MFNNHKFFWSNIGLAKYDYNNYLIYEKNNDTVYNFIARDWNNFLKKMSEDISCDNLPVTLEVYTNLMDCYYRAIKKHMSRNNINTSQEII